MYTTTQPQAATSVPVQSCTVCHSYMYTDYSIGLILLCTHTLAMSLGMHPVLKTARDATDCGHLLWSQMTILHSVLPL